ncbi:hypothetical protein [Sphaerisporangium fuscum]|uniref:hypothetical protein n=1 Tax=Sphaerisporangium fuscum TaxID=2835868 RepID=UPI002029A6A4|nr:hypothetical protein [Sphaerisporangium fuscum]
MLKKLLPATIVAAAALPAPPASAATVRIELAHTSTFRESSGVEFTCPLDEVLTGRSHSGDENGYTTYYCSRVYIDDQQVQVLDADWDVGVQKESDGVPYTAIDGRALVGRWHKGDENGYTRYRTGALIWQGKRVYVTDQRWSTGMKESGHSYRTSGDKVLTGRQHIGDENGTTLYQYGTVTP